MLANIFLTYLPTVLANEFDESECYCAAVHAQHLLGLAWLLFVQYLCGVLMGCCFVLSLLSQVFACVGP